MFIIYSLEIYISCQSWHPGSLNSPTAHDIGIESTQGVEDTESARQTVKMNL